MWRRQRQAVEAYTAELLAQAKELLLFREWVEIALGWGQVEAGEVEPGHPGLAAVKMSLFCSGSQ
jgi:hypothetical protein